MNRRRRPHRTLQTIFVFILFASIVLNGIFFISNLQKYIVAAVPDGDSLMLASGERVRLLGIDAPEKGRCMYNEARSALSEQSLGKRVRLKNQVVDDYGRILANVIISDPRGWIVFLKLKFIEKYIPPQDDPMLNRFMVRMGLAKYTSIKSPYSNELKKAQSEAKNGMLGIWSSSCRMTLNKNPDCPIKGNIKNGKKTYHMPGCYNYDQTIVDESYGDQWFCTQEEAKRAGFVEASGCSTADK